jgi:hypothetical protein
MQAHPSDGLRHRHTGEDGHAGEHGAHASAAAQTADLDDPALLRSPKSLDDLSRVKLSILGQAAAYLRAWL